MGATRATTELERVGIHFREHPYEMPGAGAESYGEAVAAAIGFPAERVFKTLVALVDGEPVVAIVPVSGTLATKALAAARGGKKASMADPADAERLTGYVTGGISPFGRRSRLPVVLDESAMGFETICVSGGKRGLQVEVAPADLVSHLGAAVAPVGS
jgi:Cys-tRNA(Pro)/Cys-tRNA(Cys) deacylase